MSSYIPKYKPLVDVAKEHGIGRTKAFELAANGDIETFLLCNKRMVYLESFDSLPSRINKNIPKVLRK